MTINILTIDVNTFKLDAARLERARAAYYGAVCAVQRAIVFRDSAFVVDCVDVTCKVVDAMKSLIREAFDSFHFDPSHPEKLDEFFKTVHLGALKTAEYTICDYLDYRCYWDKYLKGLPPPTPDNPEGGIMYLNDYVEWQIGDEACERWRTKLNSAVSGEFHVSANPSPHHKSEAELALERRGLIERSGQTRKDIAKKTRFTLRSIQRWQSGKQVRATTDSAIRAAIQAPSEKPLNSDK